MTLSAKGGGSHGLPSSWKGLETDLLVVTPVAHAFFTAIVGGPSFYAMDSPGGATSLAATLIPCAALSGEFFAGCC